MALFPRFLQPIDPVPHRWSTRSSGAFIVTYESKQLLQILELHELWTTRLLAAHARQHGPAAGRAALGLRPAWMTAAAPSGG
jgi:hypothetical protein